MPTITPVYRGPQIFQDTVLFADGTAAAPGMAWGSAADTGHFLFSGFPAMAVDAVQIWNTQGDGIYLRNTMSLYSDVVGGSSIGLVTVPFKDAFFNKSVCVLNTTVPTEAANGVHFYATDIAAGHTEPSFICEGTQVLAAGQADSASSVRVKMRINGTEVTLLAI